MPKFLCVFGMIVAAVMLLLFALDAAIGVPFGKASMLMDIGFVIVAAILGYLSFTTFREQR